MEFLEILVFNASFHSGYYSEGIFQMFSIDLRVLSLSKLKKRQYLNIKKKNYFIYNYNFFHTLLTMF